VHVVVGVGGLEEADAAVVGVAYECGEPVLLPVPKARRVTLMLDLPRVTQPVALAPSASSGRVPVVTSALAARVVRIKSRRE